MTIWADDFSEGVISLLQITARQILDQNARTFVRTHKAVIGSSERICNDMNDVSSGNCARTRNDHLVHSIIDVQRPPCLSNCALLWLPCFLQ